MAGGVVEGAAGVGVTSRGGGKTYQTYMKTNSATGQVYSGRTGGTGTAKQNVARRDASHHLEGFGPAVLDKSSTNNDAIRGREQHLIDVNCGARWEGGTSGNVINSISPRNKKGKEYRDAAAREFFHK